MNIHTDFQRGCHACIPDPSEEQQLPSHAHICSVFLMLGWDRIPSEFLLEFSCWLGYKTLTGVFIDYLYVFIWELCVPFTGLLIVWMVSLLVCSWHRICSVSLVFSFILVIVSFCVQKVSDLCRPGCQSLASFPVLLEFFLWLGWENLTFFRKCYSHAQEFRCFPTIANT